LLNLFGLRLISILRFRFKVWLDNYRPKYRVGLLGRSMVQFLLLTPSRGYGPVYLLGSCYTKILELSNRSLTLEVRLFRWFNALFTCFLACSFRISLIVF
jgi:hypothetical protein